MKRYQWEWCTGRRLSWLRGGGTRWLWATWGEWLGGQKMLFPVVPPALAARILRRAGRCPDAGCTGNAEKCAACCGRGGWAMSEKKLAVMARASEADALLALGRELLDRAMQLEREVAETMAHRATALEMAVKAREEARNG